MEVVVTSGAISRAKLQSNHHYQQTSLFYRPDALPVAQPTVSKRWREISHPVDLLTPNSPMFFQLLSLTTNSSWLPWGSLSCLSSALWCQYPISSEGINLVNICIIIVIIIIIYQGYKNNTNIYKVHNVNIKSWIWGSFIHRFCLVGMPPSLPWVRLGSSMDGAWKTALELLQQDFIQWTEWSPNNCSNLFSKSYV